MATPLPPMGLYKAPLWDEPEPLSAGAAAEKFPFQALPPGGKEGGTISFFF